MIKLPKKKDSFEFENNFYFTCNNDRISKIIIQYELFLKTQKMAIFNTFLERHL